MKRATVAVIGAGPAGATIAFRLASMGLRVQLIDPQVPRPWVPVETLSPEGRATLSRAGLWSRLPGDIARPCPAIVAAWDRPEPKHYSFMTHPYGSAWHVERRLFDRWLLNEAQAAGATLVTGKATNIQRNECWIIGVRDSTGATQLIRAHYLVLASGRFGKVSDVTSRRYINRLCLVGGCVAAAPAAGDFLLVEAVTDGWWYSMPSSAGRMFTGWITDAKLLTSGKWRHTFDTAFAQALLTRARITGMPHSCSVPVTMGWTPFCAGDRWLAIGDAAFARDPLSGDGLAHALRSAWDGATTVLNSLQGHHSGSKDTINRGAVAVDHYLSKRALVYAAAAQRWPSAFFWAPNASSADDGGAVQVDDPPLWDAAK